MNTRRISGNIHTMQLVTDDPAAKALPIKDSRVTSDYNSKKDGKRYFRFNANKGYAYAPQSQRAIFLGECETLGECKQALAQMLQKASITLDVVEEKRIDFKVDCQDPASAERWVKMGNLLIDAFITKHRVSQKNQYRGGVAVGFVHKSTKAVKGRHEIENYNKQVQQSGNPAVYRLEMRCTDTQGQSIEDVLLSWVKDLQGLKTAYSEAQDAWNKELVKKWVTTQSTVKVPLHFTDFIVWHTDHIFSRYQLRELFKLAGSKTKEQADKAVKNYCDRCAPVNKLFISKQEYEQFIDVVCEKITAYVGKTPPERA